MLTLAHFNKYLERFTDRPLPIPQFHRNTQLTREGFVQWRVESTLPTVCDSNVSGGETVHSPLVPIITLSWLISLL